MLPHSDMHDEAGGAMESMAPGPEDLHSLETTARLTGLTRRSILIYCQKGIVEPATDPAVEGYFFNDHAIHVLRRVEELKEQCGINLQGLSMVVQLWKEVERLHAEVRFLKRH